MRFPAFDSYSSVSSTWLQRVPDSWKYSPLWPYFVVVEDRAGARASADELLSVSQTQGVVPRSEISEKQPRADDLSIYRRCLSGDVVINRMSAYQGAVGVAPRDGIVSPDYLVIRCTKVLRPEFLVHLLKSPGVIGEIILRLRGIGTPGAGTVRTPRIGAAELGRISIPLPPAEQQDSILLALHREIERIDELIAKQERLIELLAEKRQAVITQALTKGLDPSAPTKPSGFPWLGDIPKHWTIRKFNRAAEIRGGQVDPRIEPWASTLLIAPNHVESGTGRILQRQTASEQGADSGKYKVRMGEVIYSKIRPYLRKVVIAPTDCLCSADMYPITGRPSQLSNRYLQELMLSQPFTEFTADRSARVAMPKVNREALAQGFLWYPPIAEQEEVLNYIDRESDPINRVQRKASDFISLLKERRSALIFAAVTGKIDVREGKA